MEAGANCIETPIYHTMKPMSRVFSQNIKEHPLSEAWGPKRPLKNAKRTIVLFEGMVIQGWTAVLHSRRSGCALNPIGLGSLDPIEYVLKKQGDALSGTEKATAIAKCAIWLPPGRPSRFQQSAEKKGDLSVLTARAIADYAGVSVRSVVRAKKRLREALDVEDGWEEDLSKAHARIDELENELDKARLVIQDFADRALPESQLSQMVTDYAKSSNDLRRQLMLERRRRRRLERNGVYHKRVIQKLEARLNGQEGI